MITHSAASKVLCFGDSNTNGIPSDDEDYVRLAADVRWTGRLQLLLGDGFDVIEEGLGGRTTDLEYDDRPGCNGRPYFGPCLRTHHPIDVVVIMLGTNDLKIQFDRGPVSIAWALHGYIDDVALNAENRSGGVPGIVLVSPPHLDAAQPRFAGTTAGAFDSTSVERSRLLAEEISRVAQAREVLFADAATVARAGSDGHHLSVGSHERLAELIAGKVRELVK